MSLSTLNKHRSVWMGIAMLWIVFFHSGLRVSNRLIHFIELIGYGGVDIFMFASGLGTYFSYTKDYDPTGFMKRRLKRLASVYIPFIVVWIFFKFLQGTYPIEAAIGNFFAVQGFTGLDNVFNWYITCLVVVYILTPFFSGLIDKINKPQGLFLLIAVLLTITIPFWGSYDGIIIITRLPIFVLGMYFAKISKDNEKRLTSRLAIFLAGAMLVGLMLLMLFYREYADYLWSYGLYWYPFIFITPGLCIFISVFAESVGKTIIAKGFFNTLKKIGEYSFEIYLIHILLLDVYKNCLIPAEILPKSNWSILFILLLVIPFCILLHACSKGCWKFVEFFKLHT